MGAVEEGDGDEEIDGILQLHSRRQGIDPDQSGTLNFVDGSSDDANTNETKPGLSPWKLKLATD